MGKLFTGCLTVAVLLCLASVSLAEDAYLTNLQLVEQAVKAAVDSMDLRLPGGSPAGVKIDVSGSSGASWLLDSVLKERLLRVGWEVRAGGEGSDKDSGSDSGFILKVRIIDLGLKYGRSWRRFALGGKIVQRVATASLYYELVERSHERVVTSSSVRSEIKDIVPASLLAGLSDPDHAFASPELAKSQWDRYLEGGLVLAIIGVLIYLFYSNKTAS